MQVVAGVFAVLFECAAERWGVVDFRFAIPVLPEPDMHVDLGDYRFLSARRGTSPDADYVSLLVSRSSDSAYVQMTRVGPTLSSSAPLVTAQSDPQRVSGSLGDKLIERGKVVLGDVTFKSGSTELGKGNFASLTELASFLKANRDKTVTLVGHTDADGSLAANIALSRQRAQSVMRYMIADLGCNPAQLSADGIGFLSPVASNLTENGRTQNRRVEALLTSTR